MRPDVVLFHLSMIRSVEVGLGRELLVEGISKFRSFQRNCSNGYSWLTIEVAETDLSNIQKFRRICRGTMID